MLLGAKHLKAARAVAVVAFFSHVALLTPAFSSAFSSLDTSSLSKLASNSHAPGQGSEPDAATAAAEDTSEPKKQGDKPPVSDAAKVNQAIDKISGESKEVKEGLQKAIAQARKDFNGTEAEKDAYAEKLMASLQEMDKIARALKNAEGTFYTDEILAGVNESKLNDANTLLSLMPKDKGNSEAYTSFNDRHFAVTMGFYSGNLGDTPKGEPKIKGEKGTVAEPLTQMPRIVGPPKDNVEPAKPKAPGAVESALSPFGLSSLGAFADNKIRSATETLQPTIDKVSNFFSSLTTPRGEATHNTGDAKPGESRPTTTQPDSVAKSGPTGTTIAAESKPQVPPPIPPSQIAAQTPPSATTTADSGTSAGAAGSAGSSVAGTSGTPLGSATSTTPPSGGATTSTTTGGTSVAIQPGPTSGSAPITGGGAVAGPTGGASSGSSNASGGSFSTGSHSGSGTFAGGGSGFESSATSRSEFAGDAGHSTGGGGTPGSFIPSAIAQSGRVLNTNPSGSNNQPLANGNGSTSSPRSGVGLQSSNDPSENPSGTFVFNSVPNVVALGYATPRATTAETNPAFSSNFFENAFPPKINNGSVAASGNSRPAGAVATGGFLESAGVDPKLLAGGGVNTGGGNDNLVNQITGAAGNPTSATNSTAGTTSTSNTVPSGVVPISTRVSLRSTVRVTTAGEMNNPQAAATPQSDNSSVSAQIAAAEATATAISVPIPSSSKTASFDETRAARTVRTGSSSGSSYDEETPRDAVVETILPERKEPVRPSVWTNLNKGSATIAAGVIKPDAVATIVDRALNGNRELATVSLESSRASGAYRAPEEKIGSLLNDALTGRGMTKPLRLPLKTQDVQRKSTFGSWYDKTSPLASSDF